MNEHNELMARITHVLETPPQVPAPADFSARLMAQLPAESTRRAMPPVVLRARYGRTVALVMVALVLVGMVCAALMVRQTVAWNLAECLLFLQFGALTLWLVLSRQRVS